MELLIKRLKAHKIAIAEFQKQLGWADHTQKGLVPEIAYKTKDAETWHTAQKLTPLRGALQHKGKILSLCFAFVL